MERRSDRPQLTDPAKLADDTVLALSSIERGSKVPVELLENGVQLCDYLIQLLKESKLPQIKQEEEGTFRAVRDEAKALLKSKIDVDRELSRTEEVRNWISDLKDDQTSHTDEQVESIKEHLITITMPIWRSRTVEFRERKMKRSLIVHG